MISSITNLCTFWFKTSVNSLTIIPRAIMNVCFFQHTENSNELERTIIKCYNLVKKRSYSIGYEANRAERGGKILEQLGAELSYIGTRDQAISVMKWDPKDLAEKIENLGGVWDKFTLNNGQQVLAIQPPETCSEEWQSLKQNLLKFWPEQEDKIITCTTANQVTDQKKLIIQVNSATTSFIMLRKKMAFYIGCKAKLVCFDPPGTGLSKGIATESSYYHAIETVFDKFANNFSDEQIWIGGTSLGCFSVAYLRAQSPNINLILENGFVDLKEDMVKPNGRIVYLFAKCFWQFLFKGDSRESQFDIAKMWDSAEYSSIGKIVVISVANDQRVSQEATAKLVDKARQINEKVIHLSYSSDDKHFARFEKNPKIKEKVIHYIFQEE